MVFQKICQKAGINEISNLVNVGGGIRNPGGRINGLAPNLVDNIVSIPGARDHYSLHKTRPDKEQIPYYSSSASSSNYDKKRSSTLINWRFGGY